MISSLKNYSQYHRSLFTKLNFPFIAGKKILDIGCGDGTDSSIFSHVYRLKTTAADLFRHPNFNHLKIPFTKASVFKLPFNNQSYDYVYLHDVLHHVDETHQQLSQHQAALKEAFRVLKTGGYLIIIEGNRYNPMFYPHMVKMLGHDHFTQTYFKRLATNLPGQVSFKFFEAHVYPPRLKTLFKIYEYIMENLVPEYFRSYNVAIVKK